MLIFSCTKNQTFQDYIDFDIGLWGEHDDRASDDIFIAGKYESKKREKGVDEEIQQVLL